MRKALLVAGLCAFIISCGGGGGGGTQESISISSPYVTPNPLTIGETAYFYFYVDSVSDPQKMKYLNSTNSATGEVAQVAIDVSSGWTAPGWLYDSGSVVETAGQATMAVWITMSDGTESNKIDVTFTVQ
jgi:hypothetical protein